jgi:hypothetical protein
MTTFHVNTLTGEIAECGFSDSCLFGGAEAHYDSVENVRAALLNKQGAPTLTLSKAHAKKLYLHVSDGYVFEDVELKKLGESFVRTLEDQDYTAAGKANTAQYIYRFLNDLYKKRELGDDVGVYARAQYNALCLLLEKYGVVRAPKDEIDAFIEKVLAEHDFHYYEIKEFDKELELENEIEQAKATLESFKKDPFDWNQSDRKFMAESMRNAMHYSAVHSISLKEIEESLERYVAALKTIDSIKKLISNLASMPQEVRDSVTEEELQAKITNLETMKVFTANYYVRRPGFGDSPEFLSVLKRVPERLEAWIESKTEELEQTDKYYKFTAELEQRLIAKYGE